MPTYDDKHDATMIGLTALATGSSDGLIEASEKRGQQALVNSQDLPINMEESREAVTAATGITFGEDVNDLFVQVTLPDGWKKEGSDHDMWSYLLDDKGRRRGSIFYKAAFYDRSAHMSFSRYWNKKSSYGDDYKSYTCWVENADGEKFCQQDKIERPEDKDAAREFYGCVDVMDKACLAWLDENHPDHQDPFAYWMG